MASSSLHLIFLKYFCENITLLFLVPIQSTLLCVLSHCWGHLASWEHKGWPCHPGAFVNIAILTEGMTSSPHQTDMLLPKILWTELWQNIYLFIILVLVKVIKGQKSSCWLWFGARDGAWILHMQLCLQGLDFWNCNFWSMKIYRAFI